MKQLSIISLIFTIIYSFFNRENSIPWNLSEASFIMGLIFISIGLLFYVRNVGFFKTLAYHRYRRRNLKKNKEENNRRELKDKLDDDLAHLEGSLEFHEFCEENYSLKWDSKKYFIVGLPLLFFSYFIALVIIK